MTYFKHDNYINIKKTTKKIGNCLMFVLPLPMLCRSPLLGCSEVSRPQEPANKAICTVLPMQNQTYKSQTCGHLTVLLNSQQYTYVRCLKD